MADKALYIGIDATGKSVPLKAIDEGDGSHALKVTTTPPDPGSDTAGYETGMDWPFTYAD